MKLLKKSYISLLLAIILLLSFTAAFAAAPSLPQPQSTSSQTIHLSDCVAGTFAPTPQSEGAYIANSNTGKFHHAGCRYVGMMSNNHKVYFDSREDAAGAGYVACKVCRP
ncbi:MAG: hypothetical protein H6Q68_1030 [Firmicutes bacterium]|nr:hypothetical protein [Bacillota bacterium]